MSRDFESLERIERKLDTALRLLYQLKKENTKEMLDITNLVNAVAEQTTVAASTEALLTNLSGEIQALITESGNSIDPAALQKIVDAITANNTQLQAAVVANTQTPPTTITPVDPTPTPVTPVVPVTPAPPVTPTT